MAAPSHNEMSGPRGVTGAQDHCNKTFSDFSHHVLCQVNVQRFYGAFCDIVVKVENYSFKAHRCILAAGSPKLQTMLYDYHQERSHVLHLRGVTASGFKCILEFLYTGHLKFDASLYSEVLSASRILELPDIEQACMEFQFYRDMMSLPSSGTALPGTPSSSHATPSIPSDEQMLQPTSHVGVSEQHHVSAQQLTQQRGVSSSQLSQQTQTNRVSTHPVEHSTHPSKLTSDLMHQPRFTAQGLQQMQSSRFSSSTTAQQVVHHHGSQPHSSAQHGADGSHGHASQMHPSQIQTQPLAPSNSLDIHYSPTYKSPPPGGGHETQPTSHNLSHSSANQQPVLNKLPVSHSHSSNTSSLPLSQSHVLGGQGHLLPGQGHTEPVSQPQTPQPIMSVTPPPSASHPAAHSSLTLTPISTMDTNCIEDYLKMIESMQSEQQIQQSNYTSGTSAKTNQIPSSPVTDATSGNNNPSAPLPKPYQHKTPSSGTRNPKKDYIASADIAAASSANSTMSSSSQVSQKTLSLSASASGGGRSQYSAEDVRKTLLSVLSQEPFDVASENSSVTNANQGSHGNQYTTQNSLATKDTIYPQQQGNYGNKYYPGNTSSNHSNVPQRLNFDNMPNQNSHAYANTSVDSSGYASTNQYPGQYANMEYSSHYGNINETNIDNNSVYSANSPAQALGPTDGPSGSNRMNYMSSTALAATSGGRNSQQYSNRDQEALNMINSYAVNIQDRLSRLSPVDDNIAASALSSDSEMDDLTMEAIESLAEKMTAKDTPEDNVTPVQGERDPSPGNLMSRLSPISIASEPPHQQVSTSVHQITQPGVPSQPEPPKLLSLAAQSSLQAMLPSGDQPNTQPLVSGGKLSIMPTVGLPGSQMTPIVESTTTPSVGQKYAQPFSPSSPMSPDFGKEDRKLKMKKKRKVPVKIKLKRNYSSEHWDTMSLPSTNQYTAMSSQQQGANHSSALSNRLGFSSSQHRETMNQDVDTRFKEDNNLMGNSSHMNTQQSLDNNISSTSQTFMNTPGNYVQPIQNQPNFDNNGQNVQHGNQSTYLGSPQSFSWDDITPSQSNKLQTVQERVQLNAPQMPAKFRLSGYHQNMYYGTQPTSMSSSQPSHISQPEVPSTHQGSTNLFTGNQGNSLTTGYTVQTYDPMTENSNPERGLEQLLEKSNDSYNDVNSNVQGANTNKIEEFRTNGMDKYSRNSEYANKEGVTVNPQQPMKTAAADTMSLTTINKDDLISEIDSLKRDHEESQAIERTKLKKKKKFFITADIDSSINSPKDSPKFRILKKKYRHSFVKSVTEKVKKPAAEKLSKKKREKKEKKVHQQHGMSTLEKKRSKALELRKEAENRPLKKRLQLKPVPVKIEPSSKYKMKICPKCGREFYKFGPYNHHMQLHLRGEGHACSKCNMLFFRLSEVTIHMRQHNNITFECTECLQIYSDAKDYKKHMSTAHQDANCFKCPEPGCGYKAARVSLLDSHIETHKENKSYACTSCGKTFKQANGMRAHMKSCVQKKTYLCEFCPSKFNQLQSLKSHVRTHTGEKPHKCPECGASFTDPKNLNRHRRIHLNQFPYPCKQCEKKFRHSNSLKKHMKNHPSVVNSSETA